MTPFAPVRDWLERRQLERALSALAGRERPRVALVKQDCNEDLYCCPPGTAPAPMLQSTLLRSGPISLFTEFDARFCMVRTDAAPECSIWREKSDDLKWAPAEWFRSFQDRVPGRAHGQSAFAQAVDAIDWSAFDLVVSVDVAVPARVTTQYPNVVWAYYVREVKAPSYARSYSAPLPGQDLFLSQNFAPKRSSRPTHVLDVPYHFQRCGVFHALHGRNWDSPRRGVFVEYHSARDAADDELKALEAFGPVFARRVGDDAFDRGERIPPRSMVDPDFSALIGSKYHIKWRGRSVLGTAKVEAIAAGCLALTDPDLDSTPFLHSESSMARGFRSLLARMEAFESSPVRFERELQRQRRRVDYLCFARPANDLINAWQRVRAARAHN